ncbi:hypothetical protein [Alkalimarinus coralli]|uniref:hypothetical protein n=1 Tax=Alkalimarinus coralli TaxID=2935863 RepID=UPI00202B70CC|nr:hypothetical protein [Alkalimarinus coralli]
MLANCSLLEEDSFAAPTLLPVISLILVPFWFTSSVTALCSSDALVIFEYLDHSLFVQFQVVVLRQPVDY